MSIPVPKPLSTSTSPSLGPAAARAAAQDAHISQLVQQNRTLEHSLSQLRTELQAEKARGIEAVNQIKNRWKAESKERKDGCDLLQARHRLAHLGTRLALEHERGLRLEDKETLIHEKTGRLLREYKITLFQARETDLAAQVATLEDEIEAREENLESTLNQNRMELTDIKTKLEESKAHEKGRVKELETELGTFRASTTSSEKQVERLTLQLETLHTQHASLEARNRELQYQVDKWQDLESKGEKEVEALRKRRIDLEIRIKQLEENLKETRGMEKKIEKLENSLLEVQEQFEQGQQDLTEAYAETKEARKQVSKLEKQVAKLQAALETQKTQSAEALEKEKKKTKTRNLTKPSNGKNKPGFSSEEEASEEPEDGEVADTPVEPRSQDPKPAIVRAAKSAGKGKGKATPAATDSEAESQRRTGTSRSKQTAQQAHGEAIEALEIPEPIKKQGRSPSEYRDIKASSPPNKPRSKAGTSNQEKDPKPRSKARTVEEVNGEGQQKTQPKKRTKHKLMSTTEDTPVVEPLSARASAEEDEEVEPQKKKKRKLNVTDGTTIFGGPPGFTWDPDGQGELGIPSVLSPVKEGQPVPARSSNRSILSGWGIWK